MDRLSIFNHYDAYNTIAAQRTLKPSELAFYNYCRFNHDRVCSETTPDTHKIIQRAGKLYKKIG